MSDTEREAWRKTLDRDKHLSPEDLAHRQGVPLQTVYGWNKTRTGPDYMKIGRHVRFDVADLDAFIARGRVEPLTR